MSVTLLSSGKPALLGGERVRQEPWLPHTTMIDHVEKALVNEVLDSGVLSGFAGKFDPRWDGGKMVKRLEAAVCERLGVKHAVTFNSGTSGMHAAVAAVGVEPGDEVLIPALGWTSTGTAVLMQGGIPIFCDVEDKTFQMDPRQVPDLLTSKTKAIFPINLYGMSSDVTQLGAAAEKAGISLLEDNAHAFGTAYRNRSTGTTGAIGILSLNYHKVIQCGEGGIATTDDDELALRLRLIRNHGENIVGDMGRSDLPQQLGWNYRMTELDAAVALGQWSKLDHMIEYRQRLGGYLTSKLKGHPFLAPPVVPDDRTTNYYVFAIKFDPERAGISRATFVKALQAEGLWVNPGYVNMIYRQPMYQTGHIFGPGGFPFVKGITERRREDIYRDGICPVAERLHDETLITVLWIKYPYTERDVDQLMAAIEKVGASIPALKAWEAKNS